MPRLRIRAAVPLKEVSSSAGLILQLTRAGFLLLLWLFVWAVIKTLRSDIYAGAGVARPAPRYSRTSSVLPSLGRTKVAKNLVVTQGALAGTRITLGTNRF